MKMNPMLQEQQMKLKWYEKDKNSVDYKFQKWLIDNSKTYTKVDEVQSLKVSKQINAQVKGCYMNCFRAVGIRGLSYCEGAVGGNDFLFPVEHAWLIDSNDNVIDPTLIISGNKLDKQMKKMYDVGDNYNAKRNRLGGQYHGVKFTNIQVSKIALKRKIHTTYLFDLFQEEHPELFRRKKK